MVAMGSVDGLVVFVEPNPLQASRSWPRAINKRYFRISLHRAVYELKGDAGWPRVKFPQIDCIRIGQVLKRINANEPSMYAEIHGPIIITRDKMETVHNCEQKKQER